MDFVSYISPSYYRKVKLICCFKKPPAIHHPPNVMGTESDRCDSSSYRESNELETFYLDMCPFAHLEQSQRMTGSGHQVMCNSTGLDSHWVCGSQLSGTREHQWGSWGLGVETLQQWDSSPSHLLPVGLGSEGGHAARAWMRSHVSPILQLTIFNLENHWRWLEHSPCRGLRDGTF